MMQKNDKACYVSKYDSPLGLMTLSGEGEMLTGLWFEGQRYFGSTLTERIIRKNLPVFDQVKRWLDRYFSGEKTEVFLQLDPSGTAFQKAVWSELQKIPYGAVTTYGVIAGKLELILGQKVSARAVGGAVGHNPISVLIPCHRVLGADGSITGYAGGIEKKTWLLDLEGIDLHKTPVFLKK